MKIVYPDNIIRLGNSSNFIGKSCVDSFISLPEIFAVYRIEGKVVEKRPDSIIANPLVVSFDIALLQRNRVAPFR